jgi:hypothetical protein
MKKVLLTLLTVCMVLPMVSLPLYATPPTEVSGIFDIDVTVMGSRFAGPNMFIYGTDEEWWQGHLEGYVAETEWVVRMYASGRATFRSRYVFEGTVLGSETGTMEMQLVGEQSAPGEWWYGTWVILGGADGLANVRGQGVWYGPGMGYDPDHWYEGQVHFDP